MVPKGQLQPELVHHTLGLVPELRKDLYQLLERVIRIKSLQPVLRRVPRTNHPLLELVPQTLV